MPEEGAGGTVISTESESSAGKWVLLVLAILYVVGSIAASIYYFHDLNTRLSELDKNQQAAETQIADLVKKAQASEASEDTLAQQLGMTKKELASRSAELQRQQRAALRIAAAAAAALRRARWPLSRDLLLGFVFHDARAAAERTAGSGHRNGA